MPSLKEKAFKEGDKLAGSIPHWVPIIIKSPVFMKNMASGFNQIKSI